MAYKFQVGDAILSGSLEVNGTGNDLSTSDQSGADQFKADSAGAVSGSGQGRFGSLQIAEGGGSGAAITAAGAFAGTGFSGSAASSMFSLAVPSDGNITISGELRMVTTPLARFLLPMVMILLLLQCLVMSQSLLAVLLPFRLTLLKVQ